MQNLLALLLLVLPTAAAAQGAQSASVELLPGVTLVADGGVTVEAAPNGTPVAVFWRPVQFDAEGKVIAGRVDCRVAAQASPYRAALFEGEQVHEAQVVQDRLKGFDELDRTSKRTPTFNRFDVTGRRSSPLRYEVLTYLAVRTGDLVVNVRRTCKFVRARNIYRQDFVAYADRYMRFEFALPPPTIADPALAPSLDTLTDMPA